jgi:predicted ATPase/DNA-binding XRE family transcriptional regulator
MKSSAPGSFGAQLKALREAAGFTQEELATVAGLSVHAVSALERGERRRPHAGTVRALSAALDLSDATRNALLASGRAAPHTAVFDQRSGGSLPLALTALLGRDGDVTALREWLADSALRLVTMTGPGGAGKTRLAQEVARAIELEGAARVVFVPLAAVRDASFVASAIAEALGLLDISALDLSKRVRAACDGRGTLLVLDNFEHVLDAAPLVAELLTSVAALRLMVTSRAPLRVRGEREYVVGPLPLDVGQDASPADVARSPAVRLFVERVRDVRPEFRLTPANAPTVTAICRRLDALPLALELAAPWLKVLTPEDLLRRLAQDPLFSTPGPRDLPERQQTMNATVAWSYRLLGPNEQRVLRRLGVLSGDFPIEAAATALAGREGPLRGSDDALAAAAGLIDKSLLLRAESSVPTRPLYRMLETVRAYAAVELNAAGERDDAMEGLVRYCATESRLAAEGLVDHAQGEWLDRVRDDLENYRSVLIWLIERGRSVEASTIVYRLFFFWVIRGHASEGLEWYERILAVPSPPPSVEATALIGAAVMRYTQAEFEKSRTAATRALALSSSAADRDWIAVAELLLGHLEHISGNEQAALERYARSLEESRQFANPWRVGNALTGMARVAMATGEFEEADRLLREAASRLQGSGPWFLLLPLFLRATLAVRRGDADEAVALVRESLEPIRDLHDKFAFVHTLVPLAAAVALQGEDVWAAQILGSRHAVTEATGATIVDRSVNELRQETELAVRARLGEDRWARAYAAGRKSSIDSLMNDIDRRRASSSTRRES